MRITYHLEIKQKRTRNIHRYYTSMEALVIDNQETVPLPAADLEAWAKSNRGREFSEYRGRGFIVRKAITFAIADVDD